MFSSEEPSYDHQQYYPLGLAFDGNDVRVTRWDAVYLLFLTLQRDKATRTRHSKTGRLREKCGGRDGLLFRSSSTTVTTRRMPRRYTVRAICIQPYPTIRKYCRRSEA